MPIVVHSAVTALRRNLVRSILCGISLAIGVAAVIAIAGLSRGARSVVEAQVASAGTNMIIVSAGNRTSGGIRLGMGSSSRLVNGDAEAIAQIRGVAYVSPGVRTRQQLINGPRNWSTNVEGVGADLPRIRHWPLASGSFFGPREVQAAAEVCVIGTAVRDTLFDPAVNPIGRTIRIGIQLFRVIGVLAPKGQSAGGQDQDDAVFVPYTTAQKKLAGVTYLRNITLAVSASDRIAPVAEEIRRLLRIRHEIVSGETDDFRVRTLEEILALRTRTTRTMTALLAGVAAVSLLVGGIGVMNIMLVSVTERTREIGLRLAVGARTRDVQRQFLVEALLLSGAGGLCGVAVGYGLGKIITGLLSWPTELAPGTAFLAVGFSAAVGILFGWYPARRAARVDPIDALRYE
jgi:putative ABC transport system permease protein